MKLFALCLLLMGGLHADDLATFERKAEMNPDDPDAQFNFAVKAMEAKETKKALGAANRLVKISPKDAQAWELKGKLHLDLGQEDDAMLAMQKSLDFNPKSGRAHLALARLYAKKDDKESLAKALKSYEVASKAIPADLSLVVNQGVLLNRLGREKEALARFEDVSKTKEGAALAARYLCQLYNRTGNFKKAEAQCRAAAKDSKATAETHYNYAYALSRLGKKDEARKGFQAAAAADAGYAPALYNLGYYDYEEGKLDQALARFKAATEARGGDYPEAQYNIAVIHGEQGNWGEAADLYRKLLKKEPGNEDAKVNLEYVIQAGSEALLSKGKDSYEAGNFDAAGKAWEEALKLDPKNQTASDFLKKVKKSAAKQEGLQEAKKEVRKALVSKLKSEDDKVLKEGLAAAKAGKLSQAVKLLDFYLKKNPGNKQASKALFGARSELRQQVDDLLQRAGRMLVDENKAEAKSLLQKALALDPDNNRANKMLSQVTGSEGQQKISGEQLKKDYFSGVDAYLEGDLSKAIGIWKKVLAADPGHLDAKRSLSQAELELAALKKHK